MSTSPPAPRSEEHTSELQSLAYLVCRLLLEKKNVGTGHPHLGQAGAIGVLSGDERRSPCGAALLAVVVGAPDTLGCDAFDVRGPVAHQTLAVATQVANPDVVTPDDQNVGFVQQLNLLSHS